MAKPNPLLVKVLFIGIPVLVGVALLPTNSPDVVKTPSVKVWQPEVNSTPPHAPESNISPYPMVDGRSATRFRPGAIPSQMLSNAKDHWTYSGNVEVGGSKRALLKNKATGESVFLNAGEDWNGLRIISIDGDSIVVTGSGTGLSNPTSKFSLAGAVGVIESYPPAQGTGTPAFPTSE